MGLGLDWSMRTLQCFLMAEKSMDTTDKLAMAVAVYAASKTVAQARSSRQRIDVEKLMRLHTTEGLRGSNARRLLMSASSSRRERR